LSDIVFDVETVPAVPWTEVDEPTRQYLIGRARNRATRDGVDPDAEPLDELAAERLALELGMAKVAAISITNVESGSTAVLLEARGDATPITSEGLKVYPLEEPELLRRWWRWATQAGRLITFNGRTYDGPVLMVRSAQLGVVSLRDLVDKRYDFSRVLDLQEALTWFGAVGWRNTYTLEYWCARFGIASPKGQHTGADVARLYEAGEMMALAHYAAGDTQSQRLLYGAVRPFLHTFNGGPRLPEGQAP
jgi:3'-5' exonuclease